MTVDLPHTRYNLQDKTKPMGKTWVDKDPLHVPFVYAFTRELTFSKDPSERIGEINYYTPDKLHEKLSSLAQVLSYLKSYSLDKVLGPANFCFSPVPISRPPFEILRLAN